MQRVRIDDNALPPLIMYTILIGSVFKRSKNPVCKTGGFIPSESSNLPATTFLNFIVAFLFVCGYNNCMNIFVLDKNPLLCARYHCDKHVIKMILESAQILSTVVRESGIDAGYKPTHKNHPCTKWAAESLSNWLWLKDLVKELNTEYMYRYSKTEPHKSSVVVLNLPEPKIQDVGMTEFAQAMPEEYRDKDVVKAYRSYYLNDKKSMLNWKNRDKPCWVK